MKSKVKVLFISANPRHTPQIQVIREFKVILESIKLSRYRDDISISPHHLATVHDLRRALLEDEFDLAHISGHGTDSGIVLEEEDGSAHLASAEALAELFQVYSPSLQCVILNACYSVSSGRLISLGIPFTIAVEGRINDQAAIEFSRGFYDALGAGKDIEFAYGEGRRAVKLALPKMQFDSQILKGGSNQLALANLSSHDTTKRIRAARWIGMTRQETAVSSLVERLQTDDDPEARYWLIAALGHIGNQEAQRELENLQFKFNTDKLAVQDALSLVKP